MPTPPLVSETLPADLVARLVRLGWQPPPGDEPFQGTPALLFALRWAGDAQKNGDVTLLEDLLAAGLAQEADEEGWTPLMEAASGPHLQAVVQLLAHHPRVDATDRMGWTALMGACRHFPDAVPLLLAAGARVEARRHNEGMTPLMLACAANHPEAVAVLLAAGANPHARSLDSATPLMYACSASKGNADLTVALLLKAGVQVDAELDERLSNSPDYTAPGPTALLMAARRQPDAMRRLLDAGADPTLLESRLKDAGWETLPDGTRIFRFFRSADADHLFPNAAHDLWRAWQQGHALKAAIPDPAPAAPAPKARARI